MFHIINNGARVTFDIKYDLNSLDLFQSLNFRTILNEYLKDILNDMKYEMICAETLSRMNYMFDNLECINKSSKTTLDDIYYHISNDIPNRNVYLKYRHIFGDVNE